MKDSFHISEEFTPQLKSFLSNKGYTHLISLGIDDGDCDEEDGKSQYWLEPIKADDVRLSDNDPDYLIQEINDLDVLEMAKGQDATKFLIKVPEDELHLFR